MGRAQKLSKVGIRFLHFIVKRLVVRKNFIEKKLFPEKFEVQIFLV